MKPLTQVFICTFLTLTVAVDQKDSDEGRPYEFGFTVDGQQHRHEKKDVNGIVQGEFGFITADGIYHVTVYATDENGSFKILSRRNIRISAPLDGSPLLGPISPEAGKYLGKQGQLTNQPNQQQGPQPPQHVTQKPLRPYPFTTQPTIKPACGGCGYVTTPKSVPGQKFPFQNPAFQKPVQSLGTTQNLQSGLQNYQSEQGGGQSSAQISGSFQNVQPPGIVEQHNYQTQQQGFQNFQNQLQGQQPAFQGQQNYQNQQQSFQGQQPGFQNQQNFQQQNLQAHQSNFPSQQQNIQGQQLQAGQPNLPSQQQNIQGQQLQAGQNYQNQGQNFENFQNTQNAQVDQQSSVQPPSEVLNIQQPSTDLLPPGVSPQVGQGGLHQFDTTYQQNQGQSYQSGNLQNQQLAGFPPGFNIPNLQPQVSKLPPVSVSGNKIHVGGKKPFDIPIKDKFPGMTDGLPNGIEDKDVTNILYKFHYTVGFHGHYEKGLKNGAKIGGYFVNGRDGISRVVTYVADENGYRPKFKFINLGLDSDETPKEGTEKKFGLKSFEFVWYPVE